MILKLFWKEARENRWKAIILTLAAVLIVLLTHYFESFADGAANFLVLASLIATVWIAASTAAAERSAGSADVLLALPARPLLLFAVKVISGLLTILLPFALACMVLASLYDGSIGNMYRAEPPILLCAIAIPIPLYFMILFLTASARQESRAAMIGVLALLGCLIWWLIALLLSGDAPSAPWYLLILNPFVILFASVHPDATQLIPLQLFNFACWATLAAWRFLRAATRTGTGSEQRDIPITPHFLIPLPYPALFWKEIREQIGVFGLAFWSAFAIALIAGLVESVHDIRHNVGGVFEGITIMLQVMIIAGAVVPLFIAIVLGVGSLANDLEDRLFHFWRGQPISVERWFWSKYAVTAVGILILLVVPLSIAAGGAMILSASRNSGVSADRELETTRTAFIAVLILLPTTHALSIFFASVIRRTMYATIAAVITVACIAFIPFSGRDNLASLLTDQRQPPQAMAVLFCLSLILTTLLLLTSRILLKNNWRFG